MSQQPELTENEEPKEGKEKKKQETLTLGQELFQTLQSLAVIVLGVIFLFTFVVRITVVSGHSMENTLHHGDIVLVRSIGYTPKQGDIVVLDICLPGMLGTDVAREIRRRNDRTEIIFISISRDYAIDAFSLKAVHYVVKPFSQAQLDEALDRAMASFEEKNIRRLLINIGNGEVQSVSIDKILYIESQGYRRVVHTAEGLYEEVKNTLSRMQEELDSISPGQFIQPYRGYIVNLDAVRTIASDRIFLHDGEFILIKRGDFRRIRSLLFDWSFGRGKPAPADTAR